MEAKLLDTPITIDERSLEVGNSWFQPNGDGVYHGRNKVIAQWLMTRFAKHDAPVFADVGAHTGLFTLLAALVPTLEVYAFEPVFDDVLMANVALNDLDKRVWVYPYAMGAHEGASTAHVFAGNLGSHTTLSYEAPALDAAVTRQVVPVYTLDGFFGLAGTPPPNVIKIDVEGMEKFVIMGGEQIIRKHKPDIIFEFNAEHAGRFGYGPAQTTRLLNSWGYTCKVQGNDAACIYGANKSEIW